MHRTFLAILDRRAPSSFGVTAAGGQRHRRTLLATAFALYLPLCGFAQDSVGPGANGATAARVSTILKQVEDQRGVSYWATVQRLVSLGGEVLPIVRRQLDGAGDRGISDRGRLACAKILLEVGGLEDGDRAVLVLEDLLDKTRDKAVRVAAIRLLGTHADPDEIQPQLEARLEKARDPEILIPLAKVLWELDHVAAARDMLVRLLKAKDIKIKREAALTLAEMGYFEGSVRDMLRELKNEPSEQGRRAVSLDRVMQLSRQLDRKLDDGDVLLEGVNPAKLVKIKEEKIRELQKELAEFKADAGGDGNAAAGGVLKDKYLLLLEEVVEKTQKFYVEEGKIDRERLFLAAIEGVVISLDRFSSFMGVSDTKRFQESMAGEYFGIGAHVNKTEPKGPLEIRKILYGGPAHKAGILSSDRVVAIDGKDILDVRLDDVISKLKGATNTKITLSVKRPGSPELEDFVVVRGRVEIPSVYFGILPERIGYIRLTKFGDRSAEDFIDALDRLDVDGIESLIIDLRDNPGGRRDAAVRIVDQFVDGDLPIVTQKGRTGEEINTLPDDFRRDRYPIVVLVDGRSASASEIVAGALQDYQRATIVGERTFGKGSVQRVIQMSKRAASTLGGEARLRLTVQYYYLPSGKCIHTLRDESGRVIERGGIGPDVEVKAERLSNEQLVARERLLASEHVVEYVVRHFDELKKLYGQPDAMDLARYPELDTLHTALGTTSSKEDLRFVLRILIRRRLEDERDKDFACDYMEDRQLQRGILKILEILGGDPASTPQYRRFPEWLADEESADGD